LEEWVEKEVMEEWVVWEEWVAKEVWEDMEVEKVGEIDIKKNFYKNSFL
jgi:hypothetical protein